jgi:hypothetical protein
MTREELSEMYGDELLFLTEPYFDDAIMGVVYQCSKPFVCYNVDKILEILMKVDKMNEVEAIEYYYFNMVGSYVGENTPVLFEEIV